MRLTTKGQMTIPKQVRDDMGIGPGSRVAVERNPSGEYVLVNLDARQGGTSMADELIRHLQEAGRKARRIDMTAEELMELTRGPFNDLDSR